LKRSVNTSQSLNSTELFSQLRIPEKSQIQEAQRIFHGRGHAYEGLHHLSIDWLPPMVLITLFAPLDNNDLVLIKNELINKIPYCESIQIQHRYQKDWLVDCMYGDAIEELIILENNLKYKLKIKSGENTGLFLDMKNGRDWIRQNSKKKRVLNLFSYTCGFSIAAIAGDANSVFNIDMSRPFLNVGRENHRLNQHSLESIRFEKLNIMKSFGRIKRHAPYDLIICDPPTFQKGSIDLVRDYPKLIRRFPEFMSADARLFLCINSPHLTTLTGKEFLTNTIKKHAPDLTLQEEIKPPSVFKDTQDKGTKVFIYKR